MALLVTNYTDGAQFLAQAQPTLQQHEAENSLILGTAAKLELKPDNSSGQPLYLATVHEAKDGVPVLTAMLTPPYNLTLSTEARPELTQFALEAIAQNLRGQDFKLPGVLGPKPLSQRFAEIWANLTGQEYKLGLRERVFALTAVVPPQPKAAGRLRRANVHEDVRLMAAWVEAFHREALGDATSFDSETMAKTRLAANELYLWEDATGQVVSMAGKARPTANGITVNAVYTPPEARGQGYASACVSELSQLLLDEGFKFCTLFTDLANPISNSIYQKIGYHPVCDFDVYNFS